MSESAKNIEPNSELKTKVWSRLFNMFYHDQKKLFHSIIFLALITAATEAGFTLVTKWVIDDIVAYGADQNLVKYSIYYFLLVCSLVICIRVFILLCGRLSVNLMYDLRKRAFQHLQNLSFAFYDKHAVGWLVARVTSDCAQISRMIAWGTLDLFWAIPFVLGIFTVLLVLNWQLALVLMSIFPFLMLITLYFRRKILKSSRVVRRMNSRLTAVYNEGISGVKTSKILVREEENLREFKQDTQNMFIHSKQNLLLSAAFYPLVTIVVSIGTGLSLWLGGLDVLGGLITLGSLIAFIAYSRTLIDPLLQTAETLTEIQRVTASAERVLGLLAEEPQIIDSEYVLANIQRQAKKQPAIKAQQSIDGGDQKIGEINFQNVNFSYNSNEPVLKNFNFTVKAGSTVALVGATGSGKSTIISLMCRFYEPVSGKICINGVDYRDRSLAWLQSNLGIVLQTPFLFSGTIHSNIRYGKLNASIDEVIAAAKLVNLHDIIMEMEHGYETVIEEGGDNLSTGQKQLISFARAVIAQPQILVMDEATSSVDTQTEHLLQQSLNRVLENRTSFIVAHRLSTIRCADHILVIDKGELLESGNHQELLTQKGAYFDLYQKQFIREQEENILHH